MMLLNYTMLANNTGFERETVEGCLREVLQAFARRISSGVNVNLDFSGVGRLVVKERKVKMKFFKEFIESMDEYGNLKSAFVSLANNVFALDHYGLHVHVGHFL